MKPITEIEKSYIAGLVDGEGTIGIYPYKSPKNIYVYFFRPMIAISMTSERPILWCYNTTGLGSNRNQLSDYGQKKLYRWQVGGELECISLIEAIKPYLLVKDEQANLLLEFFELKDEIRRTRNSRSMDDIEFRNIEYNKIRNRMRVLNGSGESVL